MKVPFAFVIGVAAICLPAMSLQAKDKAIHLSTALNGASQVPPIRTKATGQLEADFDAASRTLRYSATYSGLSGPAVAAHFHGPAAAGANAPPVVPITDLSSPIKGSAVLTADQAMDLLDGKWYFNVHTAANPGGEIRGQLPAP